MTYYPCRSTTLQNFSTIAQTVYEICVTNFFHFLAPGGLAPGIKFTKRGDGLVDSEIYHPAKFHRSMSTHARDILYKSPADTQKKQKLENVAIAGHCNLRLPGLPPDTPLAHPSGKLSCPKAALGPV